MAGADARVRSMLALFILLAGWSTGGSWGLSASIVRGVRGWAEHDSGRMPVTSPFVEPLRPVLDPYATLRRGPVREVAAVEIIELGERPLPPDEDFRR